ncbi:MAG: ribosome recycling factor [Myxococcales bacterium]|nr:ribosome recycling factor [Myxococcales bacterium]
MLDDVLKDLSAAIAKAHEALKRELAKLRTGRANAAMLDSVRVDYYGTATPLAQMANISVPEPRLITVKPWDRSQVKAVEKAIRDAELGLNPQPDGEMIRIPIPALNEERRRELVKVSKKYGEEAKVAIRKARHDALDFLSEADKDGEMQSDEVDRGKKKVEDVVADGVKHVDTILAHKEKDSMEI